MRRKKQRQFLRATPALNQLPTWRRKGQKRARRNLLESESESEISDYRKGVKGKVESLHQPEGFSDNPTELDMNEEEDEKTRHCSSSLLPLIRSDLPADIKDTFLSVLKGKLTAATDYTILLTSEFRTVTASKCNKKEVLNYKISFQLTTSLKKKAFITDPYVMKMSLSKYATNFEVMWSDSKRPLKVLNRLLDILLKIHLAPEQEQKHKAYIAKKKKEMEQKRQLYISEKEATTIQRPIGIIKKSRNGKRNLFNIIEVIVVLKLGTEKSTVF
ncbi:hypothetical protein EDC94DRAFT_590373 [Helicostylum pulchrum]|nr:hypothetical protein EDC94DRAFT_590373 [Helicostylum pulchrum]